MSTTTLSAYRIDAADVRQIVVSDIVTDKDGLFVRAVRFYGDGSVVDAEGSKSLTLLHEVICRSANRAELVVSTPAAGF